MRHSILMGRIYWSSMDSYLSLILPLFITLSLPFPFSLTPAPLFLNTSFSFFSHFLSSLVLPLYLSFYWSFYICFPFLSISGSLPSLVSSGYLHPLFFSFPLYATLLLSGFLSLPSRPPLGSPTPLSTCVFPFPTISICSRLFFLPHSLSSFSLSITLPPCHSLPLSHFLHFVLSFSPALNYLIFLPVSPPFYHFLCFTPHTLTFSLFFSPSLFLSSTVHTLYLPHTLYLSTPPSTLLSPHLILPSPSLILIFLSLCLYFFLSLSPFPFSISTFLSLPYFLFFLSRPSLLLSLYLSLSLHHPSTLLINIFESFPYLIALR